MSRATKKSRRDTEIESKNKALQNFKVDPYLKICWT